MISIAKTASRKMRALIHSMKGVFSEVALCLYNSTIWPCVEYCCRVWSDAPSFFLELLDKVQKQIWRTLVPSFVASLDPLAHCQNPASFSMGIPLVDVHLNWLN